MTTDFIRGDGATIGVLDMAEYGVLFFFVMLSSVEKGMVRFLLLLPSISYDLIKQKRSKPKHKQSKQTTLHINENEAIPKYFGITPHAEHILLFGTKLAP